VYDSDGEPGIENLNLCGVSKEPIEHIIDRFSVIRYDLIGS
jgi:hypothetical protein